MLGRGRIAMHEGLAPAGRGAGGMPQPCARAQGAPVAPAGLPRGWRQPGAGAPLPPAGIWRARSASRPARTCGRLQTPSVRAGEQTDVSGLMTVPCFISGNRGQLGQREVRPGAPVPDRNVRPGGVARRYAVRQAGPASFKKFSCSPISAVTLTSHVRRQYQSTGQ